MADRHRASMPRARARMGSHPDEPVAPPRPAKEAGDGGTVEHLRAHAREQRLAARGNRILDALATLITRWGYGKTTVDDIAREAGVAKGTVYLHWPSKGAMLHALLEREERQWQGVALDHITADPSLSGLYRQALVMYWDNPLLRALLTQDRDALGEWTRSPESHARARRRMEATHALIRAWREAGWVRADLSVTAQAYLLAALSYGILMIDAFMPAEFVPPPAEVLDAFASFVQHGLEQKSAGEDREPAEGRAAMTARLIGVFRTLAADPDHAAHAEEQEMER